ncbi:flagellar protein [Xanthomonas citri pv. citri str. 306]|uniref:Flagellar motor switch protein FliN n=10 Tax=Xanthomonas TaxID=338 RepID=A0AAI7ZF50_XANAC|nr:flagellar protein [Xanthomonas citri pv. citri str. 306]
MRGRHPVIHRRIRRFQWQQRRQDHRRTPARRASPTRRSLPGLQQMINSDTLDASPATFDSLQAEQDQNAADLNLDVILDVPVTLSLEVGRARIPIRNLLQLNQGSVVELERGAGEPLDVYVNGTLIAHGEVVVINDRFGIRLTDVVSPSERIRRLR